MSWPDPPNIREIPPSLKTIIPYLNAAVQFEKKDIVVAYYCRVYAANLGIKAKAHDAAAKKTMLSLMGHLEAFKKSNSPQYEGLSNEVIAESKIEGQAMTLFTAADKLDRAGTANQNVVKMFFTAAKLFEVLTYFKEDVTDYVRAMYKYAAWKATYISGCLKSGETPVPGPASVKGSEEEDELNMLLQQLEQQQPADSPSNSVPTPTGHGYPQPSSSIPPTASQPQPSRPPPKHTHQPDPAPNPVPAPRGSNPKAKTKSPAEMEQASKYCKFAQSSIMFNDVETAVNYLEQALALLKS